MLRGFIKKLIEQALKEKLQGVNSLNGNEAALVGYNPIEKIRGALFWWILVPFNGKGVWCQLRCPNATQIETCGDITNIIDENAKIKNYSQDDLIKIRNYQEALCQLVMNIPTYENIASIIGDNDFLISGKKKELEEIRKKFEKNKKELTEVEKDIINTQIKLIEFQIGYILPDDTMAFLTRWAMGNDVSDIKRITKEHFLRAAGLAKAHGKAPSDYLSGIFTDYNKIEIDTYAIQVLEEHLQEHKALNEGKNNWFFGGRKNTKNIELPKRAK